MYVYHDLIYCRSHVTCRVSHIRPPKGSTSKRFPMAVRDAIESSSNHFSRICTWGSRNSRFFSAANHGSRLGNTTIDTQVTAAKPYDS